MLVTSSATGQGLEDLGTAMAQRVELAPGASAPADPSPPAEHRVFRPAAGRGFAVERVGSGFRVSGEQVDRLVARYDLDNEEALAHLEGRLRSLGVIDALAREGFEAGDDVEISGVAFELDPGLPA